MLFSLILLAVVTSQVSSDPTNPLSDTGQAENLINSFLRCIVQSRAFPQQELSSRVNAMKKTLISSWNSRKTPKEKSQSTTLTFASTLADLTKPGNSPASVALKKRTVQQCLQKGSIETEGTLNYVFVQEMMQAIDALQEKSKNTNAQPVVTSVSPRQQPTRLQSLAVSAIKANIQPPSPIMPHMSLSKNFDYSDDILPSYESKIPIASIPANNAFILPSPSVDAEFTGNIPQIPLNVPQLESLQDIKPQTQANLFSNPYDLSNDFKTSLLPNAKINDYNSKDLTSYGDSPSANLDTSINFPSPLPSRLQGNSFTLSNMPSSGYTDLASIPSPFSGPTGMMAQINSFQKPEDAFSRNPGLSKNFGLATDFSNNFGGAPDLSNNFGLASGLSNNFGLASALSNNFGMAPDLSNNFGMAPDLSNNFGMASDLSNTFGMASDLSNTFGMTPDLSNNFGMTSALSNSFGMTPDLSNNFGLASDLSNTFGLASDFSNNFGLVPSSSNNFGLTSNAQTDGLQTDLDSSGISNGYQAEPKASNVFMGTQEDIFSPTNINLPYDADITSNFEHNSPEAYLTDTFDSGLNSKLIPSAKFNSNYDEGTALNLEPIPTEDFSTTNNFDSEKEAKVKNDLKDSIFLNIISSDKIANFLQKATKEIAEKFANELDNSLGKIFGYKSNTSSKNMYQNLFTSSEYPLDEYTIADSLATLLAEDLFKQGILNKNELAKIAEDTNQAINDAISQVQKLATDATSMILEDTNKTISLLKKFSSFEADSDSSANSSGAIENQTKLSATTAKTTDIIKSLLTAAGIEKITDKIQLTEQGLLKVIKSFSEQLIKELKLPLSADKMSALDNQLKDIISKNTADLPLLLAKVISNILENTASNTEEAIQTAVNVLLKSLSDPLNFDGKTQKESNSSSETNLKQGENTSPENLLMKFINQLKSKIIQSGILKVVSKIENAIDIKKLIENFSSNLADKLGIKNVSDLIDSTIKKLDAVLTSGEEAIATALTNFAGNLLESQQKLISSTLNDIVNTTFECLLRSLSDLNLKDLNASGNLPNQKLSTIKSKTELQAQPDKFDQGIIMNENGKMISKQSPDEQMMSKTKINGDATGTNINGDATGTNINGDATGTNINADATGTNINADATRTNINDADIALNIQNEANDASRKSKDKTTAEEMGSSQKLDTKTNLSGEESVKSNQSTNKGLDAEENKSQDLVTPNDSKDSVPDTEIKQQFVNALKANILGTGILDSLLDKTLNAKDVEDMAKKYLKLLTDKFQILGDNNITKLISETLSNIKSDTQNAVQKLANVTADILMRKNILNQNSLSNVLDQVVQSAVETFSGVMKGLNIGQIIQEATGLDLTKGSASGNLGTSKPKSILGITADTIKHGLSQIFNLDTNNPTSEDTLETNVDSGDTKPETLMKSDSKPKLIDLLKAKADATGIAKNLEKIQLTPQEVAAMSERYSKLLSDKLKINTNDDTAMSFLMEFLNSGNNSASNLIDTFLNSTADMLSDQGLTNLKGLSDVVIQCLTEAISQTFNLGLVKEALAAVEAVQTKTATTGDLKTDNMNTEETAEKLALEGTNKKSKDMTATNIESNIMADLIKPLINSKTDAKQGDSSDLDTSTDINGETKLRDRALKSKDMSMQATADVSGQTAAENTGKLKANGEDAIDLNSKILRKEDGTSALADSDIKKNFASLMKEKILKTEKLNAPLEKSITDENVGPLSKLYAKQLSEKLQTDMNNSVVERLVTSLLLADKTVEELATVLADTTADIIEDTKLLTSKTLQVLAEKCLQSLLTSVSQLLNLDSNVKAKPDSNSNVKAKLDSNSENDSASTESDKPTLNSDSSSNTALKSDSDISIPDQNQEAAMAGKFNADQEFIDQLSAQVNKDTSPKEATSSSDTKDKSNNDDKDSSTKPDDKKDKSEPKPDMNKDTVSKNDKAKQKDASQEKENTSPAKVKSVSPEEIKQKLAMDLGTALATSEDFRLSALTGELEDIMQAITAAIEAVCGKQASAAFLKTFNASIN